MNTRVPRIIKPSRLSAGRAVISHMGTPVVASDAITLLSGVNFGSVEKVLAAVHAIAQYAGLEAAALIELSNMPLNRVIIGQPEFDERACATRQFCQDLVGTEQFDALEDILKLRGRFGAA